MDQTMDLRGWDYTGRNIEEKLYGQFCMLIDCLSDPQFVGGRTWGGPLQQLLAREMGTSPGTVRTVKAMCANFGLINEDAIHSRAPIKSRELLTKRGQLVYQAAKLESQLKASSAYDAAVVDQARAEISKLYEEAYCEALLGFYFDNGDGTYLHPLRATLRALDKYGPMDKWEWYLLNTCVRHDDDEDEEAQLDSLIRQYRDGGLTFTMDNVVEKEKGHQYTPQHYAFAGLLNLRPRPWQISPSPKHGELKQRILADDFLTTLYAGGLPHGR